MKPFLLIGLFSLIVKTYAMDTKNNNMHEDNKKLIEIIKPIENNFNPDKKTDVQYATIIECYRCCTGEDKFTENQCKKNTIIGNKEVIVIVNNKVCVDT